MTEELGPGESDIEMACLRTPFGCSQSKVKPCNAWLHAKTDLCL